ncbi:MAG: hypothetical protein ACJ72L_13915 [Marmoricola sp.]
MTYARGATRVATAALLLVAVTACADDGSGPQATPTPTSSSSSPAPVTTSPTPQSDSDIASEAASALVTKYYATVDRLGQRPSESLDALSTVATGVQLTAQQTALKSQRRADQKQVGDTKIARLDVQSVNLDNTDPDAGKVPTVQIDVCWDVSGVDVVDATGKSIVSSSRPETGWTRLTVANYHYAANPTKGWRVATGQDLKKDPCDGS